MQLSFISDSDREEMMLGTFVNYDDDDTDSTCTYSGSDEWSDLLGNVVITANGIEFAGTDSGVNAWSDITHTTRFYDFTGGWGDYTFTLRMFDDGLIMVDFNSDDEGCGVGYYAISDDSWTCADGN